MPFSKPIPKPDESGETLHTGDIEIVPLGRIVGSSPMVLRLAHRAKNVPSNFEDDDDDGSDEEETRLMPQPGDKRQAFDPPSSRTRKGAPLYCVPQPSKRSSPPPLPQRAATLTGRGATPASIPTQLEPQGILPSIAPTATVITVRVRRAKPSLGFLKAAAVAAIGFVSLMIGILAAGGGTAVKQAMQSAPQGPAARVLIGPADGVGQPSSSPPPPTTQSPPARPLSTAVTPAAPATYGSVVSQRKPAGHERGASKLASTLPKAPIRDIQFDSEPAPNPGKSLATAPTANLRASEVGAVTGSADAELAAAVRAMH